MRRPLSVATGRPPSPRTLCRDRPAAWRASGLRPARGGTPQIQWLTDSAMLKCQTIRFLGRSHVMDDRSLGSGMVYHAIERDGWKFNFLVGWEQASVSQITTIFASAIDMVLTGRPPRTN